MSGTLILDSEALSQVLLDDRAMAVRLAVARKRDARIVVCAATVIEADHGRVHPARLSWVLSQLTGQSVTMESARTASSLLKAAGLHGHKYAIDAMVVATALDVPDRPVDILTSDPEDLSMLLGDRVDTGKPDGVRDALKVRIIPL